jgi:hypothetical protein
MDAGCWMKFTALETIHPSAPTTSPVVGALLTSAPPTDSRPPSVSIATTLSATARVEARTACCSNAPRSSATTVRASTIATIHNAAIPVVLLFNTAATNAVAYERIRPLGRCGELAEPVVNKTVECVMVEALGRNESGRFASGRARAFFATGASRPSFKESSCCWPVRLAR